MENKTCLKPPDSFFYRFAQKFAVKTKKPLVIMAMAHPPFMDDFPKEKASFIQCGVPICFVCWFRFAPVTSSLYK